MRSWLIHRFEISAVDGHDGLHEQLEFTAPATSDGAGIGATTPSNAATERAENAPATRAPFSSQPGRATPPRDNYIPLYLAAKKQRRR
jgi:hypothetical protein